MNPWQDVRYGARMLWNSPAFALTAALTIALGIGATTSVFSVCDAMLWKPVPLPRMESLVMVLERVAENPREWGTAAPADVDDLRRGTTAFQSFASWTWGMANIVGAGGEPERVAQCLATADFFDVMGVQPALGRAFQAGEDEPGREREVILSDRLWRRRFGADPAIAGHTIRLDDQDFTVVGVMPSTFDFPLATEVWTPIALKPAERATRASHMLASVARLKPGRTIAQAAAEADSIGARLQKEYPGTNQNRRFLVWPALEFLVDYETRDYLRLLLFSVLFVLLIACANVANLQFARATGRLREVAVRTALGASRGRVIGQLVTESVLLSLLGAALGLLVAQWGLNLILSGMPPEVERYILGWKQIRIDSRTLAFTLAAAVASGILAGLAPALQCSRPNLTETLKEGGRGSSAGRARYRLRNSLVGVEVALALVLLVGASLMVRSFQTMQRKGAELDPPTLLTMRLAVTEDKYREKHQVLAFYRQVLERVGALPGVRSVAAVTALPYSNHSSGRQFTIEGRPVEPGNHPEGMYQWPAPRISQPCTCPCARGGS